MAGVWITLVALHLGTMITGGLFDIAQAPALSALLVLAIGEVRFPLIPGPLFGSRSRLFDPPLSAASPFSSLSHPARCTSWWVCGRRSSLDGSSSRTQPSCALGSRRGTRLSLSPSLLCAQPFDREITAHPMLACPFFVPSFRAAQLLFALLPTTACGVITWGVVHALGAGPAPFYAW